jgi:DNA polymerase III epsilon subunit-like protein
MIKLLDILNESEVSKLSGQPLLKWFLDRINNTFVFFDTETTGLLTKDPSGGRDYRAETEQITQIGAIATELNGQTLKFMAYDKFNQKIRLNDITKGLMQNEPDAPASDDPEDVKNWNFKTKKGILKFNHYDLVNSESFEEERKVLESFDNFLKKQGGNITLIAHNAPFDLTMIQFHEIFKESTYEVIDSIEFFKNFFFPTLERLSNENERYKSEYDKFDFSKDYKTGLPTDKKSNALGNIASGLNNDTNELKKKLQGAHDAIVDCEITMEVLGVGLSKIYNQLKN